MSMFNFSQAPDTSRDHSAARRERIAQNIQDAIYQHVRSCNNYYGSVNSAHSLNELTMRVTPRTAGVSREEFSECFNDILNGLSNRYPGRVRDDTHRNLNRGEPTIEIRFPRQSL